MNGPNCATLFNVPSTEQATSCNDEIVSAAQAGSPGAFAELHTIYSRRLYKTIFAITRNSEDAEDALQETFMRGFLAIHKFEGRSTVYSWLTRIAINCALLALRKRRARQEILFDPELDAQAEAFCFEFKDTAPNPEQFYDLRERRMRALAAIHKLGPCLRAPIRMQLAKEISVKEISRALNLTEATVKTRLHRARLRLAETCQR